MFTQIVGAAAFGIGMSVVATVVLFDRFGPVVDAKDEAMSDIRIDMLMQAVTQMEGAAWDGARAERILADAVSLIELGEADPESPTHRNAYELRAILEFIIEPIARHGGDGWSVGEDVRRVVLAAIRRLDPTQARNQALLEVLAQDILHVDVAGQR